MESNAGRVHRTVAEKRRIVELTLAPGMSVARVAQAEGVNSHQVFQWRRAFRAGGLLDRSKKTAELLPVIVAAEGVGQALPSQSRTGINAQPQPGQAEPGGTIHIELLGRAMIRVERGADASMLRAVLEGLRK
jgi:transposase